ncbi:TetR/AcrR family transcriptional regulator [Gordonia polyisoprenivorans]|uniref:TetR/AcrR family transcriptional regulator n=1 Tax=Gordonia polyisoprenivorans TaxID=84595 RepID=UPI002233ED14|nr:TetR/AcrR family transcriptional regulator [Gordonia polyisoprenivorans]UZF54134.1 TetR/AcrR family transcriptional regulator [Gordonia polyisoprenivorans]WCB35379.1 TetR/AcrR family transcriptional regulator [Gordonia polyisoprenivorans]
MARTPARSAAGARTRVAPRQPRAFAMRRRLLDATTTLLAERPDGLPTTQDIADHCDVSIGTVYRYFADVGDILFDLRQEAIQQISSDLAVGIGQAIDAEPLAAITAVVDALTSSFERHAPVIAASLAGDNAEFGSAWAQIEAPLVPLGRILPTRFRPDLSPAELDDLVFLTMGATASLCLRVALARPATADRRRLVDTCARMLLAAFAIP